MIPTTAAPPPSGLASFLGRGIRFSWQALLIIVLINTGIAGVYWIEDPRPFWHPLVTVQAYGLSIAYCVNAAQPWDTKRPLVTLMIAVAIGALIGCGLTILLKGYTPEYVMDKKSTFLLNLVTGFLNGVFVSLFWLLKIRETRAAEALHKADAERLILSKQAMESELKLMQAQIEPHFLFNTLASVQFLTETDPPQASRLLGHLLSYLRAALPQMRSESTTLGQELELAEAYLNILRMRMGPRLDFAIDVPASLKNHPFPPVLLISIVENAVTHGLEPLAAGGRVDIRARQEGERLLVTVEDTGIGLSGASRPGRGVGLINVRERLSALFGARGRFSLEEGQPRGARATIEVPAATANPRSAVAQPLRSA
jgi:sensor histidine kinase YesM